MAASPGAPGTREGLMELMRIRSASVSTRYSRSIVGAGMVPPQPDGELKTSSDYRLSAASRPGTPPAPIGTVMVEPLKSFPTGS